jgi:hypothetical protein
LHVVGGGIRQRKAGLQRKQVQIEMKKRRSLQQLKRPLIGIGYEFYRLMLQNVRRNRPQRGLGGRIGRHQPLLRDKFGQQARGLQPFERLEGILVQDPENPAVVMRNIAGRVAKGSLVTDNRHQPSTRYLLNQACIWLQTSSAGSLRAALTVKPPILLNAIQQSNLG